MSQEPDDRDSRPESPIAAAIRSKRQRRPATEADLAALEASIIADLEAFNLHAVAPAPESPTVEELATAQDNARRAFPAILPEGVARPLPTPAAAAPAAPAPQPVPATSLLQELRQQAEQQQRDDAIRQQESTAVSQHLDEALRRVFAYCHDLVQQLNILKPTVERRYSLLGNIDFTGLQWQEGFADYRTRPHSAGSGSIYEQVTLSCHLLAPEKLTLERDAFAAEKFRSALFDTGVVFSCDEIRNSRYMLEKAVFAITAEVKISLRWVADLAQGVIVLESRNLERFGNRNYVLKPEAVSLAMLDQFARLLLGQANDFRNYYSR